MPRSDAEENRRRILFAARAALEDPDVDVSMAEISRQAGVGMATLYRNFPGKHELLEALYGDDVAVVCRAALTAAGDTAGEKFGDWLRAFFAFIASKRQVASELLEITDRTDPIFGTSRAKVTAAGTPLFVAARDAGDIRADLSFEQILDMVHALARIRGDARYVEPILASVLDGLRPVR